MRIKEVALKYLVDFIMINGLGGDFMKRNWAYVIIAGIIEVMWAMGLKYSNNLITWAGTFFLIYVSFVVLMKATKKLPVATVYAVFTGIGTAGTVLVEMVVFGEPFKKLMLRNALQRN
ncbi:DMT family transporter [Peribacillus simplex]|uniref:DMT family transporter n=1 Tax=Peribacillus simplex TaxID=1478 RepID=UPI001F4F81BB|nr:multidrug efflux SMR transporter [Peribacillus simplex]